MLRYSISIHFYTLNLAGHNEKSLWFIYYIKFIVRYTWDYYRFWTGLRNPVVSLFLLRLVLFVFHTLLLEFLAFEECLVHALNDEGNIPVKQ